MLYTSNAEHGNAYLHLAGTKPPHLQYHLGVLKLNWLVCWREQCQFSGLDIASLAVLAHLY